MLGRTLVAVSLAALSSCAKPYLAARPTAPPLPALGAGVTRTTEVIESPVDGTPLFVQHLAPASGEVSAILVIQHGLKDHGDHYLELAERLVGRSFAVTTFDMRGHGRSAGRRVTVRTFDDYVADLHHVVEKARAAHPAARLFLFGHSAGGAIAALYAVTRQPSLDGLILSGPAVRLDLPPLVAASTVVVGTALPDLGVLDVPNEHFSSDPAVVAAMDADPLIYQPNGPARTAMAIGLAAERIWARMDRLTVPLLILHGTIDKATAPAGSRDLYVRAAATDKTLNLYDGFRHDLLHEPGKERVLADVTRWLVDRVAGPGQPGAAPDLSRALVGDGTKPGMTLRLGGFYEVGPDELWRAGAVLDSRVLLGKRDAYVLALEGDAAASSLGFTYHAAIHPIGFARVSASRGNILAATGGGGVRDDGGGFRWEVPLAVHAEHTLMGVPMFHQVRAAWVTDASEDDFVAGLDELAITSGVRLGRHHRFFPGAAGGGGPYVGVAFRGLPGGVHMGALTLGTQLTGLSW